jgi:hypothetical protein
MAGLGTNAVTGYVDGIEHDAEAIGVLMQIGF